MSKKTDDQIISIALHILETRIKYNTQTTEFSAPQSSKDYIRLQLAEKEHETFACMFLNTRNKLIKYSELFRGTISSASVYPREVVKEAMACNAAAVIFAHNHPSGISEPSTADEQITQRLKDALALVDIRVLDHLVVGDSVTSFAERGLI